MAGVNAGEPKNRTERPQIGQACKLIAY